MILSTILNPFFLILLLVICIILYKQHKEYINGAYYQITKLPYLSVRNDLGRYGEYMTYKHLKKFEKCGSRFLFNLYIPKANDQTTEIDVLMISPKGIFAFESKNYSGWIFGSESQKNWYQTLPSGRKGTHKEKFYNPIMQNRTHITHLKSLIGETVPIHSIIVFSDRCTLKNIQISSTNIKVINRHDVAETVTSICNEETAEYLTSDNILSLYNKLFPYTQVDTAIKEKHIADIHNMLTPSEHQSPMPTPEVFADTSYFMEPEIQQHELTAIMESDTSNIAPSTKPQTEAQVMPQLQLLKCPLCGSNLVLRTASKGANAGNQFYGCSNYPRCRYIRSIEKETI